MPRYLFVAAVVIAFLTSPAGAEDIKSVLEPSIKAIEPKVIAWRRDFHEHPELSNREFETARKVAEHLTRLGFDEVRSNVAHTGVVATLKGGLPGPVVALRADMDALPVAEKTDLPFSSRAQTEYNGNQVSVMHACGHDAHVAILMGVAEVLAANREHVRGSVRFLFQPAEEGPPDGEEGGATLMIEEGALGGESPPEAIFGLHVWPVPAGSIAYRAKGAMAGSDELRIIVHGHQTHGSSPWHGVDPIVVASQIIIGLQTVASRQIDVTKAPAVITIGSIHGGVRGNIIPDRVEMVGTIRTFDEGMREEILARVQKTAKNIAESGGASATVVTRRYSPVTYNDPELTRRMLPSLEWAAGRNGVFESPLITGAEDFSYYQQKIPGLYIMLGINKEGVPAGAAEPNHSPYFFVNESALITGVRALVALATDYSETDNK